MGIDGRMASPQGEPEIIDPTVIPALFEHAVNVYELMWKRSKVETIHVPSNDIDGQPIRVYEGHLTRLFVELRLSVPYYTSIKNQLTGMGCIEQLRRGGGNAPSRWILWKAPTLEAWKEFRPSRAKRGNATSMMQGNIKSLHERIQRLEDRVNYIISRLDGQDG